jgi:hypothetical protein
MTGVESRIVERLKQYTLTGREALNYTLKHPNVMTSSWVTKDPNAHRTGNRRRRELMNIAKVHQFGIWTNFDISSEIYIKSQRLRESHRVPLFPMSTFRLVMKF